MGLLNAIRRISPACLVLFLALTGAAWGCGGDEAQSECMLTTGAPRAVRYQVSLITPLQDGDRLEIFWGEDGPTAPRFVVPKWSGGSRTFLEISSPLADFTAPNVKVNNTSLLWPLEKATEQVTYLYGKCAYEITVSATPTAQALE